MLLDEDACRQRFSSVGLKHRHGDAGQLFVHRVAPFRRGLRFPDALLLIPLVGTRRTFLAFALVLDDSASMRAMLKDGRTRWDVARR